MLRLKEIIQEKNITSKKLAELLKITETSLSRIVNGTQFPKPELLRDIARVLDVDIRELFEPTKNVKNSNEFVCPTCGSKLKVTKE